MVKEFDVNSGLVFDLQLNRAVDGIRGELEP